jgi:hypothetical protein
MVAATGREPSDAAWRRFGDIAAQLLRNLAERDIEREAQQDQDARRSA